MKDKKSLKMKKYGEVYKLLFGESSKPVELVKPDKLEKKEKKVSKPEKVEPTSGKVTSGLKPKKPLTAYQTFVQTESKKDKYKGFKGSELLREVAKEWKIFKRTNST